MNTKLEETKSQSAFFDPQDQIQEIITHLNCESLQNVAIFAEQQMQEVQGLLELFYDE